LQVFVRSLLCDVGLSSDTVQLMFPCLDQLITVHRTLVRSFVRRQRLRQDRSVDDIGELLVKQVNSSPVSIQTQSVALRALHKIKPQETQAIALASSQTWLPLLRPSIPIGWRLRLLRESGNHDWLLANASACVSCGFRLRNARNASDCV